MRCGPLAMRVSIRFGLNTVCHSLPTTQRGRLECDGAIAAAYFPSKKTLTGLQGTLDNISSFGIFQELGPSLCQHCTGSCGGAVRCGAGTAVLMLWLKRPHRLTPGLPDSDSVKSSIFFRLLYLYTTTVFCES